MNRKLKRDLDPDEGFDFMPRKPKQEELEVTGVSRSGRVRKKSSKLTDFESLDEIDIRGSGRKKEKVEYNTVTPTPVKAIKKEKFVKEEVFSEDELPPPVAVSDPTSFTIKQEVFSDESDPDLGFPPGDDSLDSLGSLDDIDDEELEREEIEGFQPIAGDTTEDAPSQSLYMLEKSNKKKLVIKDGKIIGRTKAQRKDKGKTRFTAYMLWAKEIRQELMKANPDLDFSQISKKLGELWATVPFNEKYLWKRRAKRFVVQDVLTQPAAPNTARFNEASKKVKSPPQRKFINKQPAAMSTPTAPSTTVIHSTSPPEKATKSSPVADSQSVFKPVGTTPLDVAAHLKLLGESLTIIGERLTEHEGQIAISGSVSVLLDSLLCAIGPLLCLTQQVPELNVIPQEQLSQLLDNIAYIMPGL